MVKVTVSLQSKWGDAKAHVLMLLEITREIET